MNTASSDAKRRSHAAARLQPRADRGPTDHRDRRLRHEVQVHGGVGVVAS